MRKRILALIAVVSLIPVSARAHCPLCTAGAGALAVGATYLGVDTVVVGILIGAFALALSLWMARLPKKQYFKQQKLVIILLVFLSTILPLLPLLKDYTSVNIYWFGEYGSAFYNTYMYNKFVVGSILGALIMLISPYLSRFVTKQRGNKLFPYQGIIITFVLLIAASLVTQFAL
jgi:hypothetical protein